MIPGLIWLLWPRTKLQHIETNDLPSFFESQEAAYEIQREKEAAARMHRKLPQSKLYKMKQLTGKNLNNWTTQIREGLGQSLSAKDLSRLRYQDSALHKFMEATKDYTYVKEKPAFWWERAYDEKNFEEFLTSAPSKAKKQSRKAMKLHAKPSFVESLDQSEKLHELPSENPAFLESELLARNTENIERALRTDTKRESELESSTPPSTPIFSKLDEAPSKFHNSEDTTSSNIKTSTFTEEHCTPVMKFFTPKAPLSVVSINTPKGVTSPSSFMATQSKHADADVDLCHVLQVVKTTVDPCPCMAEHTTPIVITDDAENLCCTKSEMDIIPPEDVISDTLDAKTPLSQTESTHMGSIKSESSAAPDQVTYDVASPGSSLEENGKEAPDVSSDELHSLFTVTESSAVHETPRSGPKSTNATITRSSSSVSNPVDNKWMTRSANARAISHSPATASPSVSVLAARKSRHDGFQHPTLSFMAKVASSKTENKRLSLPLQARFSPLAKELIPQSLFNKSRRADSITPCATATADTSTPFCHNRLQIADENAGLIKAACTELISSETPPETSKNTSLNQASVLPKRSSSSLIPRPVHGQHKLIGSAMAEGNCSRSKVSRALCKPQKTTSASRIPVLQTKSYQNLPASAQPMSFEDAMPHSTC